MPLSRKRACFLTATALALGIASATAQDGAKPRAPPTESVTVPGVKITEAAVSQFVDSMTVATRAAGKLARWKEGVCPLVLGVRPEVAEILTKGIRRVAAQVGAPVNPSDSCPNNVEVIFTAQPQALLDNVRIMHPNLLGYFDNSAQAEKLATMRTAIQSWYITATVDRNGQSQVDGARKGGATITMVLPPAGFGGPSVAPTMFTMNLPDATSAATTDSRLGDGVSSAITNVVIVGDTSKLLDHDVYALADYVAMLALSQIQLPDRCQELPTILNLLVPDCVRTAGALTTADVAYLRALYKITTTAAAAGQRNEMIYQMKKALGAQ